MTIYESVILFVLHHVISISYSILHTTMPTSNKLRLDRGIKRKAQTFQRLWCGCTWLKKTPQQTTEWQIWTQMICLQIRAARFPQFAQSRINVWCHKNLKSFCRDFMVNILRDHGVSALPPKTLYVQTKIRISALDQWEGINKGSQKMLHANAFVSSDESVTVGSKFTISVTK